MPIDRAATLRNAETLLQQGNIEPAIEEFVRIADSFYHDGFEQKAAALYKKILKFSPGRDHAMLRVAEIAAAQGLLVEARAAFAALEEKRRTSGDARGAAEMRVRLGTLDPADFDARRSAAAARVEIGDVAAAARDLKGIAADLEAGGRRDDALQVLCEAAEVDPDDHALRAQIARELLAQGNVDAAARYLTAEVAGDDPELLKIVFDMKLQSGQIDEAVTIAGRMLVDDGPQNESEPADDAAVTLDDVAATDIEQLMGELEQAVARSAPPAPAGAAALTGSDIEDVFEQLRAEAARRAAPEKAEE